MKKKIIIGADVVATESNMNEFATGNIKNLIDSAILEQWNSADFRLFNVEAPITDIEKPVNKSGVRLRMPESALKGILELNPSLVTLANNHILDQSTQGLKRTCELFKQNDIPFIGVGEDRKEAEQVFYWEFGNKRIGFFTCAEHEFSTLYEESFGANPYDPLETFDIIAGSKAQCDMLIVIYHGGREHYRYPSPNVQKTFRKMSEKGADVVIAQHTHCIGCYELYNGSLLVYGQGNFIFDRVRDEYWDSGVLLELTIDGDETLKHRFIPYIKDEGRLHLVDTNHSIMHDFEERSKCIVDEKYVREQYRAYTKSHFDTALFVLHGSNFWYRLFNKLTFGRLEYSKNREMAVLNYIECEAHRELIITELRARNKRE